MSQLVAESETAAHLREASPQFNGNALLRNINAAVFYEFPIFGESYPEDLSQPLNINWWNVGNASQRDEVLSENFGLLVHSRVC